MTILTSLDLFSGIGAAAIGFGRAGIKTIAFCEIAPYPRRVLALRWPDVPIYEDIRKLNAQRLVDDGIGFADIIAAGFPCTNISAAGDKTGIHGEQSNLWFDCLRLIDELRPKFVVVENVADLRHRGLDTVLRSLVAIGYDAEWHCIPASAVNAPHQRDRIWIISYPQMLACDSRCAAQSRDDHPSRRSQEPLGGLRGHAPAVRRPVLSELGEQHPWPAESGIHRVSYGLPHVMDRLKCLGNASVPRISEIIGRAIINSYAV